MKIFITGVDSGIGKALVEEALKRGYEVYAFGLSLPKDLKGVQFVQCNLLELERIASKLRTLMKDVKELNLIILNAGVLGSLGSIKETPIYKIKETMDINVWSNKVIMDTFLELGVKMGQVIGMSTGAVSCGKGWNVYAISKSALNCLLKLYAGEVKETHFLSLSPGFIITPMLEEIMYQSEEVLPAVEKIKKSKKRTPEEVASLILDLVPKFRSVESGSFVDIEDLLG